MKVSMFVYLNKEWTKNSESKRNGESAFNINYALKFKKLVLAHTQNKQWQRVEYLERYLITYTNLLNYKDAISN